MARSVVTTFTANVSGYMAGIGKMQTATIGLAKSATESATKHKADWDKIGNATAVASVAIAAGVGLAGPSFACGPSKALHGTLQIPQCDPAAGASRCVPAPDSVRH